MSPENIVRQLNRNTRRKTARYEWLGEVPFGESLHIHRYRLGNGLKVLSVLDRSAPVVSYQSWFGVGSRDEKPGKTGLSHLFEHLMFKETTHRGPGEFDRLMEAAGGETNAATWTDWTCYYDNVPRRSIDMVVELEADRMAHLVLSEEQLAAEKEVVVNERRYRVEDDIEGFASEQLYALAFRKHPYRWPTIGWMKDIEGFTVQDCQSFYQTYYAPNNAILVVVGDVDELALLSMIKSAYGGYRSATLPSGRRVREPPQGRARRRSFRKPTETEKLLIGYRGPSFGDDDYAVLVIANEILVGGRSSRLYRSLVSEGELASDLRASIAPFRDPGLFEIWASARSGHDAASMLEAIDKELARLCREPVTPAELEKAKNSLELSALSMMATAAGKADQIAFYSAVLDDPGRVMSRLAEYRAVTAEQIQMAASRHLNRRHRTMIKILPDSGKRSA